MLRINVSNPKALQAAINSAVKFANTDEHNSLPTRNIMVQSANNGLCLTATDLYTSLEFGVNSSEVIVDGEFCLPATALKKIGEIIKDQSAISLEQTDDGVELSLFDAPNFVAKFETSETDEFPMTANADPKAHWIEFSPEHIATLKALTKYADANSPRVGYDALQFAMHEDTLFAYTTDGSTLAYAKLGSTRIPNFAIPVEAMKQALQVANTPDLKKSAWRVTLPAEDTDIMTLQIANTAIKFRSGDSLDLTDWILKHLTHHGDNDDYLAFEPKALTDGLKKVVKLFSKDKKNTNFVVIEGKDGNNITMTAEVYNKFNFSHYKVEMDTEYIHEFTETEAQRVIGADDFRIVVDGKNFQSMVRDVAVSKPKFIQLAAKYAVEESEVAPNSDTVLVTATDSPLGFITSNKQL